MAITLHCAFDPGTFVMTGSIISGIVGPETFVVVSAACAFPGNYGVQTIEGVSYNSFASLVSDALGTATGNYFIVDYDHVANRYNITSPDGNWQLTGSTEFNKAFGLTGPISCLSDEYATSTVDPYFIWTSTQEERADATDLYEPTTPATQRISDNGTSYGSSPWGGVQYSDWTFINEPKANVFDSAATTATLFTWQRVVSAVRGDLPFAVFANVTSSVLTFGQREACYYLRKESANFETKRIKKDWDGYFELDVKTRIIAKGE